MLINLTKHAVVLFDRRSGKRVEIPSMGNARVIQERHYIGDVDGWPVFTPSAIKIVGLPDPVKGTWYIVSNIVLNNLPAHRKDCLAPDTGAGSRVTDPRTGLVLGVSGFVTRVGWAAHNERTGGV